MNFKSLNLPPSYPHVPTLNLSQTRSWSRSSHNPDIRAYDIYLTELDAPRFVIIALGGGGPLGYLLDADNNLANRTDLVSGVYRRTHCPSGAFSDVYRRFDFRAAVAVASLIAARASAILICFVVVRGGWWWWWSCRAGSRLSGCSPRLSGGTDFACAISTTVGFCAGLSRCFRFRCLNGFRRRS